MVDAIVTGDERARHGLTELFLPLRRQCHRESCQPRAGIAPTFSDVRSFRLPTMCAVELQCGPCKVSLLCWCELLFQGRNYALLPVDQSLLVLLSGSCRRVAGRCSLRRGCLPSRGCRDNSGAYVGVHPNCVRQRELSSVHGIQG